MKYYAIKNALNTPLASECEKVGFALAYLDNFHFQASDDEEARETARSLEARHQRLYKRRVATPHQNLDLAPCYLDCLFEITSNIDNIPRKVSVYDNNQSFFDNLINQIDHCL